MTWKKVFLSNNNIIFERIPSWRGKLKNWSFFQTTFNASWLYHYFFDWFFNSNEPILFMPEVKMIFEENFACEIKAEKMVSLLQWLLLFNYFPIIISHAKHSRLSIIKTWWIPVHYPRLCTPIGMVIRFLDEKKPLGK